MIKKIVRAKGGVVCKTTTAGLVYYVETKVNGKIKKLLMKEHEYTIKKFGISVDYLPFVYGEIISYEEHPYIKGKKIQNIKFRIKGIVHSAMPVRDRRQEDNEKNSKYKHGI